MDDMDWKAAMSSEVFREYFKNEAARMNAEITKSSSIDEEEEKSVLLEQFETLEREVRASPKKLATFRVLQKKFASDPDYAEKCKPEFVSAVMMLNLD